METGVKEKVKFKAGEIIVPFNFRGVQLKKSMFQEQFHRMKQYFLAIPNDDILKGFRERAGLSAPGKDLGGWYTGCYTADIPWGSKDKNKPTTLGNAFGQWLSTFARMYRITGDDAILEKLKYLLSEWKKTIEKDGYFFYGTNPGELHYGVDKMVAGLVDIYEYTGDEESLGYLRKITDWAINNLDRRRIPATPECPQGGDSPWWTGESRDAEWYTLSENLYRAYLLTGDTVYRDFAKLWHYDNWWADLAKKKHSMTGLHAYSHINSLNSAAMAYAVTGDTSYLDTIVNAYQILQETQLFATGGYGPGERLANQYGSLGNSLYLQAGHREMFETPCGTWAAFKLARYLMILTGRAIYGDWIEKLFYNGIGAALPMKGRGKTYYYSNHRVNGAEKGYYPAAWPCCSGTYPLAVTDYHDIIYFKDKDALYVNIFVPSQVKWNRSGSVITLIQDTDFPKTGKVSFKIGTSEPVEFSLKFRIPLWVKGSISVRINDKPFLGEWQSGNWGKIKRVWNNGDIVDIKFPLDLYFAPVDKYHPDLAALMYGPVVLAADKAGVLKGDIKDPSSWILPVSDKGLVFQTKGQMKSKTFKPYFAYEEKERYYMYQEIEK